MMMSVTVKLHMDPTDNSALPRRAALAPGSRPRTSNLTSLRFGRLCVPIAIITIAALALAAGPAMMSVQVKSGQVREQPSFLGKVTVLLNYGARVQVVEQQGDWSRVTAPGGQTGWMHTSALTKKKLVMKAGDQSVQGPASGEELALAGKGFNSDVEADFKAKHQEIDFTWVNKMEQMKVAPEVMQQFLKDGGIQPAAGGNR
jgi:SH3-like domain-containing protein